MTDRAGPSTQDGDAVAGGIAIQERQKEALHQLLQDNMEAERRCSKEDGVSTSSGQPAKGQRKVPNIPSWVKYFDLHCCAEKTQQLLAYQIMLLCEARWCGEMGWQTYDTMFCQQVSNNSTANWSKLNMQFLVCSQLLGQSKQE